MDFSLPGHDIKRNDRTWSTKGGVAFLYKSELILNRVYDNNDFNIITNNETLAIELKLSNKTTLTLATIYCPDGKSDCDLFRTVTSLSDKVILFGDFNSKHKVFNYATATSGHNLIGIVKELKLIYLNNDEHTHLDARQGTTDILDMAFVTPSLKSRDIRFRVGEPLSGDHLPIEIFLDRPLQRSIPITLPRFQFAKSDINTLQNKMAEIFNSNLFGSLLQKLLT